LGSRPEDESPKTVYLVSIRPGPIRSRSLAVAIERVAKQQRGPSSPFKRLVSTGKCVDLTLVSVEVSLEIL
jgi:hypothetical protein